MKYKHNFEITVSSRFQKEEYIPIKVVLNEAELSRHIGFYYKDSDLAEFALDFETGAVNSFVLTLSNHYSFHEAMLECPATANGEIQLFYPPRNLCSAFMVEVYLNGVRITVSCSSNVSYIRSGQLILGIDAEENIAEILITDLRSDEVAFVKNELELG